MAIQKRFIHFKKFSDFNSKKLSANEANTQYTVGVSGAIQDGAPDILYQSYCWIKDTKQQWTHGQLYDGTDSLVTESTISEWGFTKNVGTYSKPSTGIPKSDLASAVQTSLGKADTAVQPDAISEFVTIEDLAGVASSGSYNDLTDKPYIPNADSVKTWGFVKGVKLNGSTNTPSVSDGIVDLGTVITAHQTLKTINGQSLIGSGDITISGGSSDANVQAVDTGDVLDDVNVSYATTAYVNGLIGDINSVLESIING